MKKIEEFIEEFGNFWWKYIAWIVGVSLTGLFLLSFILDKDVQVQNINNWVSIMVGITAFFVSVGGIALSFYNLETTRESEKEIKAFIEKSLEKTENSIKASVEKEKKYSIVKQETGSEIIGNIQIDEN
ncbi:hypothetical protein NRK67_12085 [Fusobacteria bacterium ZRK30]|nr:hypothetical protein NRK67_12085 [Fusobacteria bacterium ZRK30]